jgi:hypothetical protein
MEGIKHIAAELVKRPGAGDGNLAFEILVLFRTRHVILSEEKRIRSTMDDGK